MRKKCEIVKYIDMFPLPETDGYLVETVDIDNKAVFFNCDTFTEAYDLRMKLSKLSARETLEVEYDPEIDDCSIKVLRSPMNG